MPFVRPYTGPDGAEHPDAYFTPTLIEARPFDEVAVVRYGAYHSAATYSAGSGTLIAGSERPYVLAGAEFVAVLPGLLAGTLPLGQLIEGLAAADPFFADATHVPFPAEVPPPG